MEDVTDPEAIRQDPKVDRSVCLYGYIRGTHFKHGSNIHIPGQYIIVYLCIVYNVSVYSGIDFL